MNTPFGQSCLCLKLPESSLLCLLLLSTLGCGSVHINARNNNNKKDRYNVHDGSPDTQYCFFKKIPPKTAMVSVTYAGTQPNTMKIKSNNAFLTIMAVFISHGLHDMIALEFTLLYPMHVHNFLRLTKGRTPLEHCLLIDGLHTWEPWRLVVNFHPLISWRLRKNVVIHMDVHFCSPIKTWYLVKIHESRGTQYSHTITLFYCTHTYVHI
jgi:hypothetical protein